MARSLEVIILEGTGKRSVLRRPDPGGREMSPMMKRWMYLPPWLASLCVGGSCAFAGEGGLSPSLPIVVQPESLPDMVEGRNCLPDLVLLDCRVLSDFQAGHVKGAVWVDVSEWKTASLKSGGLSSPDRWRERFAALGVTGKNPVVVYDDGNMTDAARVWFLLQLLGIRNASVLNGGFPELGSLIRSRQIDIATKQPGVVVGKPVAEPVAPSTCRVSFADKAAVREAIDEKAAVILDVRSEEEYAGTDKEKNPRHGHLPNAINLPHFRLLDTKDQPATPKSKGRLRSPDELRRLFRQVGLTSQKPVITHCQSGGRASLAALALIFAGYGNVSNYYPSFADWAADNEAPLVRAPTTSASPKGP
jgi:thiosulfate/3-mercaptopyruvate sulfurtransferase